LLKYGVDANVGRKSATVLHFTAARDSLDEASRVRFAEILLDHGARTDLRDDILKSTPLGWACRWGQLEMAKVLLKRGAVAGESDAEPWATPMAWAKKMGHSHILRLLEANLGEGKSVS
jgi:ankyrin repeat protein